MSVFQIIFYAIIMIDIGYILAKWGEVPKQKFGIGHIIAELSFAILLTLAVNHGC